MTNLHRLQEPPVRTKPATAVYGPMRAYDLIREAIRGKRLLKLSLRSLGAQAGHRVEIHVEPHAYGLSSQAKPSLLCYRLSEGIASGEGWKILSLAEIQSVEIATATFSGPRPGYRRNDTTIAAVFAQL
jgi:hypothetical protein